MARLPCLITWLGSRQSRTVENMPFPWPVWSEVPPICLRNSRRTVPEQNATLFGQNSAQCWGFAAVFWGASVERIKFFCIHVRMRRLTGTWSWYLGGSETSGLVLNSQSVLSSTFTNENCGIVCPNSTRPTPPQENKNCSSQKKHRLDTFAEKRFRVCSPCFWKKMCWSASSSWSHIVHQIETVSFCCCYWAPQIAFSVCLTNEAFQWLQHLRATSFNWDWKSH